jgi:hypothetical protein
MANQHYGQIGDIWKHLPLTEILATLRPTEYWESHAGSTRYPLTRSWQRDFGVFHFLSGSNQSPLLGASRYRQLLSSCADFYPGSCEIAMRIRGTGSSYLLCDTDPRASVHWPEVLPSFVLPLHDVNSATETTLFGRSFNTFLLGAQRLFSFTSTPGIACCHRKATGSRAWTCFVRHRGQAQRSCFGLVSIP